MDGLETPRWVSAHLIELARKLNKQCIATVCDIAKAERVRALPAFIAANRDIWTRLNDESQRALAQFPFAIVDIDFKNDDGWNRVDLATPPDEKNPGTAFAELAGAAGKDLMFEALLLARQTAREDINAAMVVFGASPKVANCLVSLSMEQVRLIAPNVQRLSVRFDNQPDLWRSLLIAVQSADGEALASLHYHAQLLFTGEHTRTRTSRSDAP